MFAQFSPDARAVIVEAQAEARDLGHAYVGCEHILLGLLRQSSLARAALESAGVRADAARERLVAHAPAGASPPPEQLPFTPRAKKVLELALQQKQRRGSATIAPEHLLLALIKERDNAGVTILAELGVDLDELWTAVGRQAGTPRGPGQVTGRLASVEAGFHVAPSFAVRRLLMSAGARALGDGRTEITITDLRAALAAIDAGADEPPEAQAV